MGRPAIFVDRDDTIMVDVGYCKDPHMVKLLPHAAEGLRVLSQNGFVIVIVTNQSGLGRGYFTERDLESVNARLRQELRAMGADFDALYYCPHRPDEGCACRKPGPGLILKAASELELDLASSYTMGDRELDISAGKSAGTKTVLVINGKDPNNAQNPKHADLVARDVLEAARLILSKRS